MTALNLLPVEDWSTRLEFETGCSSRHSRAGGNPVFLLLRVRVERSISPCSYPQVFILAFFAKRGHGIFQTRRHIRKRADLPSANEAGPCSLRNQIPRLIIGFRENLKEIPQIFHLSIHRNSTCRLRGKARFCSVHISPSSPDRCISLRIRRKGCTPRRAENL